MVKAIFLDVDGTLRDEKKGVPRSAVRAIAMCRQKGIQVVICTGRNLASIQNDVRAIQVDGLIAGGGCFILDGNVVRKDTSFPKEEIGAVMRQLVEDGLPFSAETKERVFMNRAAADWLERDFEKKLRGLGSQMKKRCAEENNITYEDTMELCLKEEPPIHKLCIWSPPAIWPVIGPMAKRAGTIIQMSRVQFLELQDMWDYQELLPRGCSKGAAVREWCRGRKIDPLDTMSFGDGKNDIEMLMATGTGVAMADGDEELKRYASSICGAVWEDGIYNELIRRGVIGRVDRACTRLSGNQADIKGECKDEREGKTMVERRSCIPDLPQKLYGQQRRWNWGYQGDTVKAELS